MAAPLQAGDVLSYSAGSRSLHPEQFRRVPRDADRSRDILSGSPRLRALVGDHPLLIVSCYPACLGFFPSAVFLDTYLRQENLSRGLLLAAQEGLACCVAGQPLVVMDMLQAHRRLALAFPERLMVVLGGYHCPVSLQHALTELLAPREVPILFAYGMAEIDFACLAGERSTGSCWPLYRSVVPGVSAELDDGILYLCDARSSPPRRHATGDTGTWHGNAVAIRPGPARVDPAVLDELEGWTPAAWARNTGHLMRADGRVIKQLRPGYTPAAADETEFHDFVRKFDMSWMRKPVWQ